MKRTRIFLEEHKIGSRGFIVEGATPASLDALSDTVHKGADHIEDIYKRAGELGMAIIEKDNEFCYDRSTFYWESDEEVTEKSEK